MMKIVKLKSKGNKNITETTQCFLKRKTGARYPIKSSSIMFFNSMGHIIHCHKGINQNRGEANVTGKF